MRSQRWRASRSDAVCVALATAFVVLSFIAVALVTAGYAADARQTILLAPRSLAVFPDEVERIRAMQMWDSAHGRTTLVLVAEPTDPTAAPPPGLDAWPEPGHYRASPALLDERSALSARWGQLDGSIDEHVLAARNTQLLIVRPTQPLDQSWAASGFGVPEFATSTSVDDMGASANRIPLRVAIGGVTLVLGVPATVLLAVSVRRAKQRRGPTLRILELLGARPGLLTRRLVGSLLPAFAAGCGIAAVTSVALLTLDVPLPFIGFSLLARNVRAVWGLLWAMLGCGLGFAFLTLAVASHPARLGRSQAGRAKLSKARPILAAASALAVYLVSNMAYSSAQSATTGGSDQLGIWLALSCLVTILGAGPICWTLMSGFGKLAASIAAERAHPLLLLIGRSFRHQGRARALAIASSLVIVIVAFAGTWTLAGSSPAIQAQRLIDQIAGRFYLITGPQDSPETTTKVEQSLPNGVETLTLDERTTHVEGTTKTQVTLYGKTSWLKHWDLQPGSTVEAANLPNLLGAAIITGPDTRVATVAGEAPKPLPRSTQPAVHESRTFVAFRPDGKPIDRLGLQRAVSAASGPAWAVGQGGEL